MTEATGKIKALGVVVRKDGHSHEIIITNGTKQRTLNIEQNQKITIKIH